MGTRTYSRRSSTGEIKLTRLGRERAARTGGAGAGGNSAEAAVENARRVNALLGGENNRLNAINALPNGGMTGYDNMSDAMNNWLTSQIESSTFNPFIAPETLTVEQSSKVRDLLREMVGQASQNDNYPEAKAIGEWSESSPVERVLSTRGTINGNALKEIMDNLDVFADARVSKKFLNAFKANIQSALYGKEYTDFFDDVTSVG